MHDGQVGAAHSAVYCVIMAGSQVMQHNSCARTRISLMPPDNDNYLCGP